MFSDAGSTPAASTINNNNIKSYIFRSDPNMWVSGGSFFAQLDDFAILPFLACVLIDTPQIIRFYPEVSLKSFIC